MNGALEVLVSETRLKGDEMNPEDRINATGSVLALC